MNEPDADPAENVTAFAPGAIIGIAAPGIAGRTLANAFFRISVCQAM